MNTSVSMATWWLEMMILTSLDGFKMIKTIKQLTVEISIREY